MTPLTPDRDNIDGTDSNDDTDDDTDDDTADDTAEVLETGRPGRRGAGLAVVLALALAGWWLAGEGPGARSFGPTAAVPTASAATVAAGTVAAGTPQTAGGPSSPVVSRPDTLDHLVFVDAVRAVGLQSVCDAVVVVGQASCAQSLVVSDDAGTTFQNRGPVPADTVPSRLLADATGAVTLVDEDLTAIVRSLDGGQSWTRRTLSDGPPEPLPAGAPALTFPPERCGPRCGQLVWIDVAAATRHPLPAQPGGDAGGVWYVGPAITDRLLAASNTLGDVAVSTDAGRSWSAMTLPVDAATTIGPATVLPDGAGGAYAFLTVLEATGTQNILGFRSDASGLRWRDIDFPWRRVDGLPPIQVPAAVLDGELLTTNDRDGVLRSTREGTGFVEVPGSPEGVVLTQPLAGGPVLATAYGFEDIRYWLSRDGLTWTPLTLPPG